MIEENAQVIRVDNQVAWVRTQRKSTCGQCQVQKGCGTQLFSKLFGNRMTELKVINTVQVEPGDEVIVGLHESALIKSALIMYLLPLMLMLIFSLMANLLVNQSQLPVVFAGLFGLMCGFMLARRFARRHSMDSNYQPVILRRATLAEQTIGITTQA